MLPLRHPVVGTLFALSVASCLPPQSASVVPEDAARETRSAVVEGFEPGQKIRVETIAAGRVTGRFRRATDELLILDTDDRERTFLIVDITGLWVRGYAHKAGAITGAVLVAPVGALGGAFFVGYGGGPAEAGAALGGLAGAAAGAVLGVFVGAAIPQWHRRYP